MVKDATKSSTSSVSFFRSKQESFSNNKDHPENYLNLSPPYQKRIKQLSGAWPRILVVALVISMGVWTFTNSADNASSEEAIAAAHRMLTDAEGAIEAAVGYEPEDPGMAGVLEKHGFKFARSPTEFFLEMAYARSAVNTSQVQYSEQEMAIITRALNTMRGFMNQGLWSGSHASMHFLGTGSCLIKLKQPADQVAVGSMHGVYLQRWKPHAYKKYAEPECERRYRLRTVLGSELERALWLDTGLYGNGPWSTCITTYIKIWEKNNTNPDKRTIRYLEELPIYMLLCDEIEEAMGGEAILSGHWKRRDTKYYDDIRILAEQYMKEPKLVRWMEDARQMSHAMMDNKQAYIHFKELTPPGFKELYDTAVLNSGADQVDRDRWYEMVDVVRHGQELISPYYRPNLLPSTRRGIWDSRDYCDALDKGEITIDQYLDKFYKIRHALDKCEREDPRFQTEMPMPDHVPKWAQPDNYASEVKSVKKRKAKRKLTEIIGQP